MKTISVRGVRTHNLKNIDLDIPRDKLVVVTGLSGSGKSSLAFDTLYAEGQRRYVESLSTYARQFLSIMEKPELDYIEGLSPAISIQQKSASHNPRSTVGTITEIYDFLRLLFARVGEPHCPDHNVPLQAQSVSQMVDQVLALPQGQRLMLSAPVIRDRKGEHLHALNDLRSQGFVRARIDDIVVDLDQAPALDKNKTHTVEVVIDRFRVREDLKIRLADSLETAVRLSDGLVGISFMDDDQPDLVFSARFACPQCGHSIGDLEPRMFSFNNPAGACSACDGLGVHEYFDADNLVQDDELSLAEGAIRGWDRGNVYYFHMLTSLAEHYTLNIDQPFNSLPDRFRQIIFFGSGTEQISFRYVNDRGDEFARSHPFEGIIPNMERRYRDTDSQVVKENLAKFRNTQACPSCMGTRLNRDASSVTIEAKNLPSITTLSIAEAVHYFQSLKLSGNRGKIAEKILKEIQNRLNFLMDVGLNYLTLNRSADTLSGGEAQRIRLASQIGAGLVGVMYILDEPSIGLHQRDNKRLLQTLTRLKELGNTVIVVEHDEEAIRSADHIIDIGPGAGAHGGEIVVAGKLDAVIASSRSLTGRYLSGELKIEIPATRAPHDGERVLRLMGASGNNLKEVDLNIPIGLMTCVTGVSGSGKSTLINNTLYPIAARELNKATTLQSSSFESVHGFEFLDKVVDIDQNPIGRTPRSNPATYTNIFTPIRELFAATQEARSRGYKAGRFSFNVKGGRCETCQGDGVIKVEMHFLPDIYVTCDECKGKRYNRETLEIAFKNKNIHEVLSMTVEDAHEFFIAVPMIERKLKTLIDVGLSYIRLGQSATTLSGGEAQRVKLAKELAKRDTGKTLYILDEPTTGLHFHDIKQLLHVLHHLRDQGNTIVIIEHNLDVVKTADWIIDLGPEGGDGGGEIIAEGTPEELICSPNSFTGAYLKLLLERSHA
ncbi:MAG: excinuclease ABC subunit UvrA [Pseudomonadales bacterium]|jgi:excinuclease ABC subunit A|nr:excinuclease ABC subunit UvrA [Pseudomonadales bacterium]MDP7597629.1 excinuclease ABC subunit UvrA [Pseudomonadales bacterium]HJN51773.1 excinuclease ABC subunit UvrA [Pseudomonadales bacterium]|tara:strand:+ start:10785 stop:13619 length:2835 start_codon:yes stop_codon:yes gene_type:complete